MGEVRATVRLENVGDRELARRGALAAAEVRGLDADLLVDTSAMLVRLPQDMVEALGLDEMENVVVTLADDRKVEAPKAGPLALTAFGRLMHTDCLVGPPHCEPLLGQLVLAELDLVVDPARHRLTVNPESPFLPSIKLK